MKKQLLITDVLKESAQKYSNNPALTMKMGFRVVEFSYIEFYELIKKIALFLEQQGVKKGDKVAICAPNSPYWMGLFFGCNLIGAIPVPLNIQSTADIIRLVVEQAEIKIFFKFNALKVELPENLIKFNVENISEYLENIDGSKFKEIDILEEDLIQIMYTYGTTGQPKGVMLTHKNMASNLEAIRRSITLSVNDRLLSILPLSHIFEQMAGFLTPFSYGCHIIYAHSHGAIKGLLQQYKITYMVTVPEFLQVMLLRIEAQANSKGKCELFQKMLNLSFKLKFKWIRRLLFKKVINNLGGNLRAIGSGGAALDPLVQTKWIAMGIDVLPGYGLTETSPVIASNTFTKSRIGSVGIVLDNVEVFISEDKEILVKGPNVFKGYFKNEEKTNETFTKDGWFKTGDLGEFDSDGFLYIKGRKKYMILGSGGQNVYPEDIEFELNKISGIQDSAVVGIEKNHNVEIFAAILLSPGSKIDIEEAIDQVNLKLASYQQIADWMIWPELDFPRTATRKVKKEELKKVILGNKKKEDVDIPNKSRLKLILADITGAKLSTIDNKTKIVKLGLDSLMRVELVSAIEDAFCVIIPESLIKPTMTVEELEELVKNQVPIKIEDITLRNWPRSWWAKIMRAILQPILFLVFKLFVKIKIEGQANLKNLKLPVIFMPTHLSYVDAALILMALPKKYRSTISFAAARDALYQEFKHSAFLVDLIFNTFPLQRGEDENIKLGLDNVGKMLDKGYSVVIFPEGHISKDGQIQPIKTGAGLIAVEMGVQIVPMRLEGVQEIFPYCRFMPCKRGVITIKIGQPIKIGHDKSYKIAAEEIEKA